MSWIRNATRGALATAEEYLDENGDDLRKQAQKAINDAVAQLLGAVERAWKQWVVVRSERTLRAWYRYNRWRAAAAQTDSRKARIRRRRWHKIFVRLAAKAMASPPARALTKDGEKIVDASDILEAAGVPRLSIDRALGRA